MLLKYFILLTTFHRIHNSPLPNNFVQINKFHVGNDENNIEINQIETFKSMLIDNLIATSDNLKYILNMEQDGRIDEERYYKKRFVNENDEDTQTPLKEMSRFGEVRTSPKENSKLVKRQAGSVAGDTQMVLGTFQAMMRPMSMSDVPIIGGIMNNSAKENQNEDLPEADKEN